LLRGHWYCAEELEDITRDEVSAVEAEDFERAASLSAKADAAKGRLASLKRAVRAAEATCEQSVGILVTSPLQLTACPKGKHAACVQDAWGLPTLRHLLALAWSASAQLTCKAAQSGCIMVKQQSTVSTVLQVSARLELALQLASLREQEAAHMQRVQQEHEQCAADEAKKLDAVCLLFLLKHRHRVPGLFAEATLLHLWHH
jgi:uncharacterized hydantoinase/oxoprolinase family protein